MRVTIRMSLAEWDAVLGALEAGDGPLGVCAGLVAEIRGTVDVFLRRRRGEAAVALAPADAEVVQALRARLAWEEGHQTARAIEAFLRRREERA